METCLRLPESGSEGEDLGIFNTGLCFTYKRSFCFVWNLYSRREFFRAVAFLAMSVLRITRLGNWECQMDR